VDRVHIDSLQAQLEAARQWALQLEEQMHSFQSKADEMERRALNSEAALRQTQIVLACMQQDSASSDAAIAASSRSSYSISAADNPSGPQSPRTQAVEASKRALSQHYRTALEQKDALLVATRIERDTQAAALATLQSDYSIAMQRAAEARYNDALLAGEQRAKFQTLMEKQLEQQRGETMKMAAALQAAQKR
jgi:hypothetical protein